MVMQIGRYPMTRCHASLCFLAILLLAPLKALSGDYAIDIHHKGETFRGTTLFAETINPQRPKIVEVDMDGRVVWEYVIPKEIVRGGKPGQALDVEWIPSTDTILFVMPFKGIYEVDRNKKIVWRHLTEKVSHDADRLPSGNTLYTFAWEGESDPQVTEITPDGTIVWQWAAKGPHHAGSAQTPGLHRTGRLRPRQRGHPPGKRTDPHQHAQLLHHRGGR